MTSKFVLASERVTVADDSGHVVWEGKPLGVDALEVQALPDTDSAIVLLDYMQMGSGPVGNLVRISSDGSILWVADLPNLAPSECYVSFEISDHVLANTWNGFRVEIDRETGKILKSLFTK
ncbi:hypothetical protein V3C33_16410 [Micrococcaceae bacterium Sec5.7]